MGGNTGWGGQQHGGGGGNSGGGGSTGGGEVSQPLRTALHTISLSISQFELKQS